LDGRVSILEQTDDGGSIVEVNHGRGDPVRGNEVGLSVVADERHHLMVVLSQFSQDMTSNDSARTRECHFHGSTAPVSCAVRLLVERGGAAR
jgi:hypothetical protein